MMLRTLALTMVLATSLSTPALANEVDEIEQVLENYSDALSDEDVVAAERWVMAEGDDFTIFEGSGSDIGWAVYRDHHLVPEFAAEHVTFHVYDWSGYSVQVDQEMAFATFDIRMEYEARGEARERDAHGTAILVRTGDGWKLAHLHTS